jgi:hypothetical protein
MCGKHACNETKLMHYLSSADSQLKSTTRTNCCIHTYIVTSWWWETSKPGTCRGIVTE